MVGQIQYHSLMHTVSACDVENQYMEPRWTDERRVAIEIEFPAVWSWDDFYLAQQTANKMMNSVPHTVDLIYNLAYSYTLPRRYFTHLLQVNKKYPDSIGMVIWVSTNRLVENLVRSVTQNNKELAWRYAFLDDLEEAYEITGP